MKRSLLVWLLPLCAWAAAPIVIQNATVLTVTKGTINKGSVVLRDGKIVEVPQGTGLNPGHGPRHDFEVHVLAKNHPITRGLPAIWMQPSVPATTARWWPSLPGVFRVR